MAPTIKISEIIHSLRMAFERNRVRYNRNSCGPFSLSYELRRVDPEFVDEEYAERIINTQLRQLDPLKEDLAEWINKTLGIHYLTRDNFLTELDNGAVLCHLAQHIQEKAKIAIDAGFLKGPCPSIRGKCFEKAMRRSFFSRDNMENFIKFCRSLGVHENLLFESDDLVLHNQPRNVILCLLEVARIATKFGVDPPGLVQFEKEIAEEERDTGDSGLGSLISWQFQASSPIADEPNLRCNGLVRNTENRRSLDPKILLSVDLDRTKSAGDSVFKKTMNRTLSEASDGIFSEHTDDNSSRDSGEEPEIETKTVHQNEKVILTELDKKVQETTKLLQRNCNCLSGRCSRLTVRKVGEGKYNIAGRNVFVRLLKGRHTMVRVGGGWDTLEHFLLRHDPCQVKFIAKDLKDNIERQHHHSTPKYITTLGAKYHQVPHREPFTR
ncbi:growth arrest-specific protein 2-like isoform X2 [Onthophagus taurus]|uniref:growth arrest-specific protein 2-like isoform X2 n=1 Tax=Onthophagus taurus TaxID=166361 RepID=UPI0039BDC5FF